MGARPSAGRMAPACSCRSTSRPIPSKELTRRLSSPFTTIISNGMGAGPDLDWAIGHGLCEILQRDGNGLLFRALDQRGDARHSTPASQPSTARDPRPVRGGGDPRDARSSRPTSSGSPNLYCVGVDEQGDAPRRADHGDRMRRGVRIRTAPPGARQMPRPNSLRAARARPSRTARCRSRRSRFAPAGYIVSRFMAQAGGAAKSSDSRAFEAMQRLDAGAMRAMLAPGWLAGKSVLSERGIARDFDALCPTLPVHPMGACAVPLPPAPRSRRRGSMCSMSTCRRPTKLDLGGQGHRPRHGGRDNELLPDRRAQHAAKLLALDSAALIRFGADEERDAKRRIRLTDAADAERLGGHPLVRYRRRRMRSSDRSTRSTASPRRITSPSFANGGSQR